MRREGARRFEAALQQVGGAGGPRALGAVVEMSYSHCVGALWRLPLG